MKKQDLRIIFIVVAFLTMVASLVLFKTELGFDDGIDSNYILLMPSLIGIVIGLGVVTYTRGVFGLPGIFVIGIAIIHLFNTLDGMGLITTTMLSGLTVAELNIWVLVVCTIAGGVLTAVSYRRT